MSSPLKFLPTARLSKPFRILDVGMGLAKKLGQERIRLDNSRLQKLLHKGTDLALELEGSEWERHEMSIHCLWEKILESLESVAAERNQSATARLCIHSSVEIALERRFRIYRFLKSHPAILEKELPPPIIIVGLPRTGSTLLQRILALDSNA